jgi:hypothetical protein
MMPEKDNSKQKGYKKEPMNRYTAEKIINGMATDTENEIEQ